MLKRLFNWILRLFKGKKPEHLTTDLLYKYEFVDDVPDHLHFRTIYLVGEEKYYWQFVMLCPCGCNALLHMNLMEETDPYWTFKIDNRKISFSPSVDRIVGCKSHFFIKEGMIIWA